MKPTHPTVSRDTRVLLAIIVMAVATLWALARLRFPEGSPTAGPVPPVLAQLAPLSAFDDIASAVARLQTRLGPLMLGLDIEHRDGANGSRVIRTRVSALRFRDDLAVALLSSSTVADGSAPTILEVPEVARDHASQLAVVRVVGDAGPTLPTWDARRPSLPRFLIAGEASGAGLSLRPVFVGSLTEVVTPVWPDPIWALPDRTDLTAGTLVFTIEGALAGLVIERAAQLALVPADTVVAVAERLAREGQTPPGWLGIEVERLTPLTAAATGATAGLIVSWIDPTSPAGRDLRVADVVETADGQPMTTVEHWLARTARLTVGESLPVTVRQRGVVNDLLLTATAKTGGNDRPLGLAFRTIPRIGVEVVRVDAGSAAFYADLRIGDVLTLVGDVETPTTVQASRVFAAASKERPVVIGVARAGRHHVVAIERTW
jgi:hypothetical protein